MTIIKDVLDSEAPKSMKMIEKMKKKPTSRKNQRIIAPKMAADKNNVRFISISPFMIVSIPNNTCSRMCHIPTDVKHQGSQKDHADAQEQEGETSPQLDIIL